MNLTTTFNVGAAVFAVLALSACGQSRNEDVIAEDIFAPAVGTDDVAIDTVQTVFDDPFAPEAQLITDAGGNGGEFDPFLDEQTALTDASVPVVPVMTAPVFEETMPPQMQYAEAPQMQYAQPQAPSFNCGIAPSSKSQLMMFRQYCGGIAPQGGGFGGQAPQIMGANDPAQQVFMSQGFDCSRNPSSKAELAFFRANCLQNVGAPISAPAGAPVAIEPPQQFVEQFVDNIVEGVPIGEGLPGFEDLPTAAPQSYDCNILPTSRTELELYQQFCG